MQIITLASRKGGAGKTTLARHLAVEAARQGVKRVALIDCDAMRGLTRWWEARESATPERVEVPVGTLATALPQLAEQGFDLVIIDTPPASSGEVEEAIRSANLVLVPVRPSPDDLRAVGETISLVEHAGQSMIFVINAATKKAVLTGQAAVTLSQHGIVAEQTIHRSEIFPQSAIKGLVAGEFESESGPAREIEALWFYIAERIRKASGVVLGKVTVRQAAHKGAHIPANMPAPTAAKAASAKARRT